MHQPYYCDDLRGEVVMPWVFLHAIKDYYDMPWYLSKYPEIKATFNLVPSLLVQLKAYENKDIKDYFLQTLKSEVYNLTLTEKTYLIEYLFFSNTEHMIKPLPRYYDLFLQKEHFKSYKEVALSFSDEDFLDLEVLFLLSWCGQYLRENNTLVKELIQQGRDYKQEQKTNLISTLLDFTKEIIPFYKSLMESGQIEISTTPFNHPISPLLFDIQSAKESNPYTTLPKYEGSLKDDALQQIDRAINYYEKLFDKKPTGFWPAEGSVSYEFLEILAQKGIKWAASDEEVLYKSGHFTKKDIYKNNILTFEDTNINLFFRDKTLSDLIGFSYSGWSAKNAVDDFLQRILDIHQDSENIQNINVILDGENAWEHYPDNAKEFFETLYEKLSQTSWCEATRFCDIRQEKDLPQNTLFDLTPGSWINGNFDIWIGHEEKNRAWELIFETKKDYQKYARNLDTITKERIVKEFLIAESSDWFWWYGDDHHTDLASTFDLLFRTHLINIYTLMAKKVPKKLYKPIIDESKEENSFFHKAQNYITPVLDGKITDFFEWMGAGEMDLENELSSMNMDNFIIKKIKLGCDHTHCYLALIDDKKLLLDNAYLEIDIDGEKEIFQLPLKNELQSLDAGISWICDDIIEISFKKELIHDKEIQLKLFKDKQLLQLLPLYSRIKFDCIMSLKHNWYI